MRIYRKIITCGLSLWHKVKKWQIADILVYARVGNGMVGRRRGLNQAKAEWRLFKLKHRLGIQGLFSGLFTFALRSGSRLLPTSLLKAVYNQFLRK